MSFRSTRKRRSFRHGLLISRAPAIPARTGSRFRCRTTWRRPSPSVFSPNRKSSRSASAPAIPFGSRRAFASTAMTSTRARRRSRPASPGRSPSGGARRAAFPAIARIRLQLAEGTARRRVGLRLEGRAPAREGAEIVDAAGAAIGRVTSGGFGPSVGAPIAMGYVGDRTRRRRGRRSASSCAARRWRRTSSRCPSIPTPIIAANRFRTLERPRHVATPLHQGPRICSHRGRHRRRRHQRSCASAIGRRRLRRTAGGRRPARQRGAGRRRRERQGGQRSVRAGVGGSRCGQQRVWRASRA